MTLITYTAHIEYIDTNFQLPSLSNGVYHNAMKVFEVFKKVLILVSEILFPADPLTKRLESMSVTEFTDTAKKLSSARDVKGITILFEYHDPLVHHAVWNIKFRGNILITKLVAQIIYESLIDELSNKISFEHFELPVLVPIPSSNKRKTERGWNQCELICDELARIDKNANFRLEKGLLVKNKYTESQIGKTRSERLKNLFGSFSVKNEKVIDCKNVILFDDVVTTGATMAEAKRTLLDAGINKVWCIAIAH